jgi:hypothetical protein
MIAKPKSDKLPHEILKALTEAENHTSRVKILQDNESFTLKTILQGNFDDNVVLDLPEGAPPFRRDPAPAGLQMSRIDNSIKNLGYFVKGSSLPPIRKEMLFVQLLESIHPEDADIIIAMKDKKLTKLCPVLSLALVRKAFPDLIKE